MGGLALAVIALGGATLVRAHAHHAAAEIDTSVPFDSLIWLHMTVQATIWAISFPLGMVLGLSKSKYHVPLQSINVALTYAAAYLGHHHKGRQFPATVHGMMAKILVWTMVAQAVFGVFLKLHIFETSLFRRMVKSAHRYVGIVFPILGYLQMMFGITTALDLCRDQTLGQCVSHYTAGSAFLGYAVLMVVLVQTGGTALKLRDRGVSREMMDGVTMAIAGVLTIALGSYRPGQHSHSGDSTMPQSTDASPHSHVDRRSFNGYSSSTLYTRHEHHAAPAETEQAAPVGWMHIIVGLAWLVGGTLGAFTSTRGNKSFIPSVIVTMTGIGIAISSYTSQLASAVHILLGVAMALFGGLRIVHICFFDHDNSLPAGAIGLSKQSSAGLRAYTTPGENITVAETVVQHLQNYTLVVAGAAFMFSTQQSVHKAEDAHIASWSYLFTNIALSLLLYTIINFLAYTYRHTGKIAFDRSAGLASTGGTARAEQGDALGYPAGDGEAGEYVPLATRRPSMGEDVGVERGKGMRDGEEFELGEESEEEDVVDDGQDGAGMRERDRRGLLHETGSIGVRMGR